ncbi:MAG: hypothetical protein MZV63_14345 [Marinilabiliales bacterium]|nr:hypothetical protein [Marinilabiliales bacterium]
MVFERTLTAAEQQEIRAAIDKHKANLDTVQRIVEEIKETYRGETGRELRPRHLGRPGQGRPGHPVTNTSWASGPCSSSSGSESSSSSRTGNRHFAGARGSAGAGIPPRNSRTVSGLNRTIIE